MPSYGHSDGIGYFETVVRSSSAQNSSQVTAWQKREILLSFASKRKQQQGPLPLEALCIKTLLQHLESLSPESLDGVPWELGRKLWVEIKDIPFLPVSLWTLFATAYPTEFTPEITSVVAKPGVSLETISSTLHSPGLQWLTSLTVTGEIPSKLSILALSKLTNLIALDLSPSGTSSPPWPQLTGPLDDSILRDLGRHATEAGGFPNLRALIIDNQPQITPASIPYLTVLPALAIIAFSNKYCFSLTLETAYVHKHGWKLPEMPYKTNPRSFAQPLAEPAPFSEPQVWDHSLRMLCEIGRAAAWPPWTDIKRPVLNYRYGSVAVRSSPLAKFVVLERTRMVLVPTTEDGEAQRAQKKRKIRPGRAVDLGSVLKEFG